MVKLWSCALFPSCLDNSVLLKKKKLLAGRLLGTLLQHNVRRKDLVELLRMAAKGQTL